MTVGNAAFDEEDLAPITDSDFEVPDSPSAQARTDSNLQASTSGASSSQPQASSSDQARQLGAQAQQPQELSASEQAQAVASEQQAAADMSSAAQQDAGQFDPGQAARVSPEQNLSPETNAALNLEQGGAPASPSGQQSDASDESSEEPKPALTKFGQKKGRPKTKAEDKPPKKATKGRPRKAT